VKATDCFLSAFSLEVHNSVREPVAAWPTGPEMEGDSMPLSPRQAAWENLAEFIPHVARAIPSIVLVYQDDSDRILVGGGGRKLTCNGMILVILCLYC
jgi:hypothetical protein